MLSSAGAPSQPVGAVPGASDVLAIVAHRVHGPGVFDDQKGDPLPFADVQQVHTAEYERNRVNNKKSEIEIFLMA